MNSKIKERLQRMNGWYVITVRGYSTDATATQEADAIQAFRDYANLRSSRQNYTAHGPFATFEQAEANHIPAWGEYSRIFKVSKGRIQNKLVKKRGTPQDGEMRPGERGYIDSFVLNGLRMLGGTASKKDLVNKIIEMGLDRTRYKADLLTIRANIGQALKRLPNVKKVSRGIYALAY